MRSLVAHRLVIKGVVIPVVQATFIIIISDMVLFCLVQYCELVEISRSAINVYPIVTGLKHQVLNEGKI